MGDSVSYLETAGTEMGCGWVVLRQLGVLMPLETYLGVGAGAGISVGVVIHQMCLILWTWRKLANEINVKNAPKICWKIVATWGIQTALAIHITQSQDYPYVKDEYKLVVAIYHTRMTILEQEMTADI